MTAVEVDLDQSQPSVCIYPREHWFVAIASQRLSGKPALAQVLDCPIAMFRDAEGRPHALQDRCAHRGVELHLGEVRDGALACPYHGWRYGGDGRCIHIPSLVEGKEVAKSVAVHSFPCVEANGYVWVWMGRGAPAEAPSPIEDFESFNWIQGALVLNCETMAVVENNLDWCHPVFAHPGTHGMYFMNQALGFRDQLIEMRRTERGLVVFQPPVAADDELALADAFVALSFDLPDRVTVSFNAGPQGPTRIVMHIVPTGPATCRQEWLVSVSPVTDTAKHTLHWTEEPQPIFEQDRHLMELAQRTFESEGHEFERSVEADAPTLLARRIYDLACRGRWASERERLPRRRLLSIRT